MLPITEICFTGFPYQMRFRWGVEAILEISCAQFLTLIPFVFSLPIFLASLFIFIFNLFQPFMFTVCSERGEFCGTILISLGDAYPPVLSSCPTSYFPCPTLSPPSSLIYTFYLVHRSFSYHTICSWPFAFLLPHENPSLPTLHISQLLLIFH